MYREEAWPACSANRPQFCSKGPRVIEFDLARNPFCSTKSFLLKARRPSRGSYEHIRQLYLGAREVLTAEISSSWLIELLNQVVPETYAMFRVACMHVGAMQVGKFSVISTDATAVVHSSKHGDVKRPDAQGSTFGGKALPSLGSSSAVKIKTAPRSLKSTASTSTFKGVTKHKSTGKYEAHLWDSSHVRPVKVSICAETCFKLDLLLINPCLPCQLLMFADIHAIGHCRSREEERVVSKYTWVDMTQSRQQRELMMWRLSSSGVMTPRQM